MVKLHRSKAEQKVDWGIGGSWRQEPQLEQRPNAERAAVQDSTNQEAPRKDCTELDTHRNPKTFSSDLIYPSLLALFFIFVNVAT